MAAGLGKQLRLVRAAAALSIVLWVASAWRSNAGGPVVRTTPQPVTVTAPAPTTSTVAPPATTRAPARAARARPADRGGPYRVGITLLTFTDPRRPSPSRAGGGNRVLVTEVHYPIDGDPAGPEQPDAPIASARPFPLVVFAHGFNVSPTTYDGLTSAWARAGYVVASPAFPGTVSSPAGGADEADLPNQVIDVAFEITAVQATAGAPTGPLSGGLDPTLVAVAGHSDGGETVAGVALDSCCVDPRVKASIVLAGAELALPGGGYPGVRHAPALIVQGDADQTDLPANDQQLYGDIPGPKWYLDLLGGDHLSPFTGDVGRWSLVPRVTTDFLDWKLKHRAGAAARFARDANVAGVAVLAGQS